MRPQSATAELESILATMLIPQENRDYHIRRNREWLLRNLGVQNRNHPRFEDACRLLKAFLHSPQQEPNNV